MKTSTKPSAVQLPALLMSKRPTPIPVVKKMKLDFHYFETREDARHHCGAHGIPQSKIEKLSHPISGFKWAVPKVVVYPTRKKAPKGL